MHKIYRIVDNTNGNVYIGKTKKKYLSSRLASHRDKSSCCSSSQIIKNGDYKIELIEETEDETRERYWIENTECINKVIPGRTGKEYYDDNRDQILYKKKITDSQNRDKIREYNKKYNENNKDKLSDYYKIRNIWYSSMGGNPYKNNLSLLKSTLIYSRFDCHLAPSSWAPNFTRSLLTLLFNASFRICFFCDPEK